ncbi:MAG: MmgE/PrpD family protein, partial [Hyphomicrobiaceae bacterium]
MGIAQELATFVCGCSADRLPAPDRGILRRHMADVVVARIAGSSTREGRAVAALYPRSAGLHTLAGLAGMVRLTEIDDIHIESCTTPSSVAVPVALGLAGFGDKAVGPDVLASAIWAGTELTVRLGKAISGASVLYQGVWPTRAGAALGAAAAACRMWGLDEQRTAHALAFAVMLTNGRAGRFAGEPSGRWLLFAETMSAGLRAAEAARAGFKSDPASLERAWLERSLGVPVDIAQLTSGLVATSVFQELSLKPVFTSRQELSPTAAMRDAMA